MRHELTGRTFGRLSVLTYSHTRNRRAHWLCRCACGAFHVAMAKYLVNGDTKSCGCLDLEKIRERAFKHGHASGRGKNRTSPTYKSWASMMSRCYDIRATSYPKYGAKGVRVCKQWHSFMDFLADMGERPAGTTLDRKNNDLGYGRGNCRWATPMQQGANQTTNRLITFRGVTKHLSQWARDIGIGASAMHMRLKRHSVERALTQPRRGAV